MCWSQNPRFGWKYARKMIEVRVFCLRQIGESCHMKSTFEKIELVLGNMVSEPLTLLGVLERWFWVFLQRFCRVNMHLGLEPWWKMMRRAQASFWRKQHNSFQGKLISFTGVCRTSGFRKNNIISLIEILYGPVWAGPYGLYAGVMFVCVNFSQLLYCKSSCLKARA